MTTVYQGVEAARSGVNPALICRVASGWVVLCDQQFLRGYSILLPDPVVDSLNALSLQDRSRYLGDMARVGDALLEVTGAYRVNYAILGNSNAVLHAHIVPRYLSEPDELRRGLPWSYGKEVMNAAPFDPERDRRLMEQIASAIQRRL